MGLFFIVSSASPSGIISIWRAALSLKTVFSFIHDVLRHECDPSVVVGVCGGMKPHSLP